MRPALFWLTVVLYATGVRAAVADPKATSTSPKDPDAHGHGTALLGLSFAQLTGHEDAARDRAWAVLLFAADRHIGTRRWFTMRGDRSASIGGGSGGFAGEFDLSGAFGIRLPLDRYHGPLVRAGLDLSSGWGRWFTVDLPQAELGYQVLTPLIWLEGGARAALNMGFGSLHEGSPWVVRPSTGAYLRAGALGMALAVDAKLTPRKIDGSDLPYALVQADLCTTQGIALCMRFTHLEADVSGSTGARPHESWNLMQLVLGIGGHSDQ